MGRTKKLLEQASRNPNGLKFMEFEKLLETQGWIMRRQSGSHRLWYSPKGYRLPIQPTKDSHAKGYQVRQFLEQWEQENHESVA
jgi:predicted RNA binding protein YcfA (HicA-like mRNA interferase family)